MAPVLLDWCPMKVSGYDELRPVLMRDLTVLCAFALFPELEERGDGGLYEDDEKEPFISSPLKLTPFIFISFCSCWYFCLI